MSNQKEAFIKHQLSLPKLPVPSLDHLATQYLRSIQPLCHADDELELLSDEEFVQLNMVQQALLSWWIHIYRNFPQKNLAGNVGEIF